MTHPRTWAEFWQELAERDAAWTYQERMARLTLEHLEPVRYRGPTPAGTWAADVGLEGERTDGGGPAFLMVEGRTPAELVVQVLAVMRGQVARG